MSGHGDSEVTRVTRIMWVSRVTQVKLVTWFMKVTQVTRVTRVSESPLVSEYLSL